MMIHNVGVYCASSSKAAKVYFDAASELGRLFGEKGWTCINGAGNTGLMAEASNAVMRHGGKVVGIIPKFMVDNGWCHSSLTELIVVESMHERKQMIAQKSDAVVALPGGVGTFEELLEMITWKQLGLFAHPIVILNTDGYYNPLLEMFDVAVNKKFMGEADLNLWFVADSPEQVIEILSNKQI